MLGKYWPNRCPTMLDIHKKLNDYIYESKTKTYKLMEKFQKVQN